MTDTTSTRDTYHGTIVPRYTDLDTWRHVNNSRAYQLHLEARMTAHVARFGPDAWFSDSVRLRPVRTITQFRQVSWYGSNIDFTVRVLACGIDTYRLRSELYQGDTHVGTQECLMRAFLDHEWVSLPAAIQDSLSRDVLEDPEPLPPATYSELVTDLSRFPLRQQLTPRYADLDADSQRGEAAIARYMEQARFGAMRRIDLKGSGILIAGLDITFQHYRPGWEPVDLGVGVSHTGNTSFHLTGGAESADGVHAVANSIMVVVDQETTRPTPLTEDIRRQLNDLSI